MNRVYWAGFLILTFVITLPVSWWLLAKIDFGYAFLHDHIGIAGNIDRYAPKNDTKPDFADTSKELRIQLFSEIVKSIENQGVGLKSLSYLDKKNNEVQLLTQAEIIHLQDVAILLQKTSILAGSAALLWLIIVFLLRYQKKRLPPAKQAIASSMVIILILVGVLSLGPEKVFNQLHIWVFPDNHQWFFYYEESLMSTMMKAPDLFAYIAAMWFLISILLTILLWNGLKLVLKGDETPA